MYYVYMIESFTTGVFYKGSTSDYIRRLSEHNEGLNVSTKGKGSWRLIFVQCLKTKKVALIRERQLKKCNKKYLKWLIDQPANILKDR